jgi:hypothetical protein
MMKKPAKKANFVGKFGIPKSSSIRVRGVVGMGSSVSNTGTEIFIGQERHEASIRLLFESEVLETV